eukprot:scaffold376_cov354-Prasinococcus_capsulatus_cf.AAC.4
MHQPTTASVEVSCRGADLLPSRSTPRARTSRVLPAAGSSSASAPAVSQPLTGPCTQPRWACPPRRLAPWHHVRGARGAATQPCDEGGGPPRHDAALA